MCKRARERQRDRVTCTTSKTKKCKPQPQTFQCPGQQQWSAVWHWLREWAKRFCPQKPRHAAAPSCSLAESLVWSLSVKTFYFWASNPRLLLCCSWQHVVAIVEACRQQDSSCEIHYVPRARASCRYVRLRVWLRVCYQPVGQCWLL